MGEVAPDTGLTLTRNEDYWNPELPYVDQVQWNVGVAPDLSILRIQAGEQDVMQEPVPAGQFNQLETDDQVSGQLVIGDENLVWYITLSLKVEALADLRVRQAIAMSVDKERLLRTAKGLGTLASGGLFSPKSPYYQEGLAYPFDPDQGRALLAEAGYADGFDIDFLTRNTSPGKEIGEVVGEDLRNLGLRPNVQFLPRNAHVTEVVKNPAAITWNGWELPYPHGSYVMDGAFTQAAIDAGCCNFSNYMSPEFDTLAEQAHRSTDEEEIVALYKEMDRIAIRDEALWVPLYYPKQAQFVSERLRGFFIPAAPIGEQKFFAQYWIDEG
jgi:ABC-type transport system substrate-binding protein